MGHYSLAGAMKNWAWSVLVVTAGGTFYGIGYFDGQERPVTRFETHREVEFPSNLPALREEICVQGIGIGLSETVVQVRGN